MKNKNYALLALLMLLSVTVFAQTCFSLLAGAMATSPVTALPVNETNNPKTEYTTDMKDMPYYPILEITAPQTKAPKTTGEKFIEWLTEVLTSIDMGLKMKNTFPNL